MAETKSAEPPLKTHLVGVDEAAIKAICAAIVLGEDERGKPVHLSAEEAHKAIAAYQSVMMPSSTGWLDMATAPKDGTMLRLLVVPDGEEFTPFDDSLNPFETIGFNNLADTKEDRWEFAGWDWSQDCFTTGRGEAIGWSPFTASRPDPFREAVEWCLDRDQRNGSLPEAYADRLRAALTKGNQQ